MPRPPRVVQIRRLPMVVTVAGRTYSYVFLVRIASKEEQAILDMKERHPGSVHLLEYSPIQGWNAFIPRWTSHQRPTRFLSEIGRRTRSQCQLVIPTSGRSSKHERQTRRQLKPIRAIA
jgi:hypothetical protein